MPWRVELTRRAAQSYEQLSQAERRRVDEALASLERDPRPPGKRVKPIKGVRDAFLRYRVGDHRLMYEVFDDERAVLVYAIVARKDLETWLRRQR